MRTVFIPKEQPRWYLVDATDRSPGRIATEIARRLRGKHRVDYAPGVDLGDCVVVVNAGKIRITGNKGTNKVYYRHSGYPGALKTRTLQEVLARRPQDVIMMAVKGMLPRGPLGRRMLRRLKVYADAQHPHQGQRPEEIRIA